MCEPTRVVLLSGKRKSGKDFIAEQLLHSLGEDVAQIIRISAPIKVFWAKEQSLDLTELMADGPYKEQYRKDMINWSDVMRQKDAGCFCREAAKNITKLTCIVADIRRKTDIAWFRERFGNRVRLIRIMASDATRGTRGWKFQEGVDDVQSECDLDDFIEWDLQIINDGISVTDFDDNIKKIVELS